MDICFHYFGVKSIARAAGFPEDQAQIIATFSQFIDDYNWYVYFRANNIPDYVIGNGLDIVYNETLSIINPVTTGFSDYIDLATLILPRSQKFTVCPFHFIPQDEESRKKGDNRTVPATLNDGSYISGMLNSVKSEILDNQDPALLPNLLMKMGSLCHTFADTYAHQLFTGFNNQSNSVSLLSVTNNITGNDETEQYRYWIEKWISKIEGIIHIKMPTIGHMAIAHIPDLTHLSFSMNYKDLSGNDHVHSRSNTETFVKAANQLYTYFRTCLGDVPANMSWDDLQPMLASAFLFNCTKELDIGEDAAVEVLIPHWSDIFTEYSYSYSSTAIKNAFILSTSDDVQTVQIDGETMSLVSSSYSDDFYHYNLYADQLLIVLYGENPRSWLG